VTGDRHRALREFLGAYVLGHLDGADRDGVRLHLDECHDCRGEYAALAPLAVALRDVDPEALARSEEPDALLERRVRSAIVVRRHRRSRRHAARLSLVGAAACVALVVSFLAGAAITGESVSTPPPLEPVAVNSRLPEVEASADLVDHTWGLEIRLAASGLRGGDRYKATVTAADGREVDAGAFLGVAGVEIRCNMNAPVLRDDAVALTIRDHFGQEVMRARF
jgi:hypothetical protein